MPRADGARRRIILISGWLIWLSLLASIAKHAIRYGELWSTQLGPIGQQSTPMINQLWLGWVGVSLSLLWAHKRMPRPADADAAPRAGDRRRGGGAAAFGLVAMLFGALGLVISLVALAVGSSGGLFHAFGLIWPAALALLALGIFSLFFG